MSNFIEIKNLTKTFDDGRIVAVDGVDLSIGKGEFVSLMGPSGCGKSTLLNLIAGLDVPDDGSIIVDGKDLNEYRDLSEFRAKRLGFVFQLHNLISNLNAIENVQIPMFELKLSSKEKLEKARKLLELVGLKERAKSAINKLSGGERQRVAIARAFANDPEIIIADEPTGSLDSKTSEKIMKLIKSLQKEKNLTVILVTHSKKIAEYANRTIEMLDGKVMN